MKHRFRNWINWAAIVLPLAWALSAAWLSAKQLVGVRTEVLGYSICFLIAVVGVVQFLRAKPYSAPFSAVLLRWTGSVSVLLVIGVMWRFSDDIFCYWKLKIIPTEAWPQMISALEDLGKQAGANAKSEGTFIPRSRLRDRFLYLGKVSEYAGGFGQINETDGNDITARVAYGWQGRRWGLFIGTSEYISKRWPKYRAERVAGNAYFFVGPDF